MERSGLLRAKLLRWKSAAKDIASKPVAHSTQQLLGRHKVGKKESKKKLGQRKAAQGNVQPPLARGRRGNSIYVKALDAFSRACVGAPPLCRIDLLSCVSFATQH